MFIINLVPPGPKKILTVNIKIGKKVFCFKLLWKIGFLVCLKAKIKEKQKLQKFNYEFSFWRLFIEVL